tara:strand:- start:318 stop:668 length:351 start_codon:yes stop_codon:yes gene_type:complete
MRKEIFFGLIILSLVLGIVFVSLSENNIILVNRFDYQPEDITIKKGTTVYWFNIDLEGHNVTSDLSQNIEHNKILQINLSKDVDTLGIISYKFNEKGEFHYYCILHPYMKGTILVS